MTLYEVYPSSHEPASADAICDSDSVESGFIPSEENSPSLHLSSSDASPPSTTPPDFLSSDEDLHSSPPPDENPEFNSFRRFRRQSKTQVRDFVKSEPNPVGFGIFLPPEMVSQSTQVPLYSSLIDPGSNLRYNFKSDYDFSYETDTESYDSEHFVSHTAPLPSENNTIFGKLTAVLMQPDERSLRMRQEKAVSEKGRGAAPSFLRRERRMAQINATREQIQVTSEDFDETDERKPILPPKETKTDDSPNKRWLGILLAIASGIMFTVSSAGIKMVKSIDPTMILLIRVVEQLIILVPILLFKRLNPYSQDGYRLWMMAQAFVGCGVLNFIFIAFSRLEVGDATAVIFSSPVFVMIFSIFMLREHCGLYRVLTVVTLLGGVSLIARPDFLFENEGVETSTPSTDPFGWFCAFMGTIFMAFNYIITRRLRGCDYSCILFNYSLVTTISTGILVYVLGTFALPDNLQDWGWSLTVGVTGLAGQILLVKALRLETAGTVSVVRCLDIAFGYMVQVFVFGVVPQMTNLFGAVIVCSCVLSITFEDRVRKCLGTEHSWL